jgi:hypothetical protein
LFREILQNKVTAVDGNAIVMPVTGGIKEVDMTEVLLLEDRYRDGVVVSEVLEMLNKMGSLRVMVIESHALGFFSHSQEQPLGIVLFLNGQEAIGIFADTNYKLMQSDVFGIRRLSHRRSYTVLNAAKNEICFINYLMNLTADSHTATHLNN